MFRRVALSGMLALTLLLAACGSAATPPAASVPSATAGGLRVIAIESFLADMAQQVAGDRATVESLIPLGVDPHGFEPTPADVQRIAESDVVIANGAGFEEFLAELIANAGGERRLIEAAAGLESRAAREGEAAVMTDDEKADSVCAMAGELTPEELAAAGDASAPAELHAEEEEEHGHAALLSVTLTRQADGSYGGFLKLHGEPGDTVIAAGDGQVGLTQPDTRAAAEAEETMALSCAGLTQAAIYELDEAEYVVGLSGFRSERATLLVGPVGGHSHDEGDPHFWLDPTRGVRYVENIRDGLIAADPQGEATYRANADAYITSLQKLDAELAALVATIPAEERKLVTNHESFGYFADRYGFQIVGTIVPSVSSGAAPSAQQLARLTERVRAVDARAIFLETGANPQLAEQLARETGVKVVFDLYTHSLSEADGPAPSYVEMLRHNTRTIVEALK